VYPEVDGATTWYLGPGLNKVANKTQRLIEPVTEQALAYEPPDIEPPAAECIDLAIKSPRYHLLRPAFLDDLQWQEIRRVMEKGYDFSDGGDLQPIGYEGWSHIDAMKAIRDAVDAGYPESRLLIMDGDQIGTGLDETWMGQNCPALLPYTLWFSSPTEQPPEEFRYTHWPAEVKHVTQHWGANPGNYPTLPGHDGVDIRAARGTEIYTVADGVVYRVETRPDVHNYGIHVRVRHNDSERTIYAHLEQALVKVGELVKGGQAIGYADNTGNSTGDHLHFGRKLDGGYTDEHSAPGQWPYELADPTPFLKPLAPDQFPDNQPPQTHPVDFGLHARADGGILPEEEFKEFQDCRPDIIKILSSTAESGQHPHVSRLSAEHPGALFVVRAFLEFGGRTITPAQFFTDTLSDVQRSVNAISSRGNEAWIELHNEPNLVSEGWNTSWGSGVSFNSWLLDVLRLYRNALPSYKYLYPGLSPGPAARGRSPFLKWIEDSREAAEACDGIGVHAYWNSIPDPYDMNTALADVDAIIAKFPDSPIFLTESSNKTRPTVRGVTYFVASASDPTFAEETWIDKGIGAMVANR
jgi:murein DD-endopeptidase MepM/ murein hydrolase activator NlpD